MEFLRTLVVNDVTPGADGVVSYDLPVLPQSHLLLTIKALNVTDEATISELLAMISKIEVSHLGKDIFNMSALDCWVLNLVLQNRLAQAINPVADDNGTRAITIAIPFGRKFFDPGECYKATNKGELQISLTVDIANAGADGLILQLESVQLPEASPSKFLKCVTSNFTPGATGESKVSLPLGTTLAGVLLWATTVPATTAWTTTINKLELLVDEIEHYYTGSIWETLHGAFIEHIFSFMFAEINTAINVIENHVFLNFIPTLDDEFLLSTEGKSAVDLNIDFGDTNPIRIIPVQLRNF